MFKKLSFLFFATIISVCGFASTLKVEKVLIDNFFEDCIVLENGALWNLDCNIEDIGIRVGDELEITDDGYFYDNAVKHLPSGRYFAALYLGSKESNTQSKETNQIKKIGKIFLPDSYCDQNSKKRFIVYAILSDYSLRCLDSGGLNKDEVDNILKEFSIDSEDCFVDETDSIKDYLKTNIPEGSIKTLKGIDEMDEDGEITIHFQDGSTWAILNGEDILKKGQKLEAFSFKENFIWSSIFSMDEEKFECLLLYPLDDEKKFVIAYRKTSL